MMHSIRYRLAILALGSAALAQSAVAATTNLTQTINSGSLSLTSPVATNLPATTLTGSSQATNGPIGQATVTDSRGTGAGWVLTATVGNFAHTGSTVRVSGSAGGATVSGAYSGATAGSYTITISQAGSASTAAFQVSGLETQTATQTAGTAPLGTRGLSLNFSTGTYSIGDQWTVAVDVIPASAMILTPSAVGIGPNSDGTGVSAGAAHSFTGTTDAAVIMTASSGNGLGSYTNTPNLALTIPPNVHGGAYTTIITETVN